MNLPHNTLFVLWLAFACINALKFSSVQTAYKKGVDAYSGDRWSECITQFEEAIHLYKIHKQIIINCRHQCNTQQYELDVIKTVDDLQMYEKLFKIRNCLFKCQERGFEEMHITAELDDETMYQMETRKPYEFLHMCYFEMNALPKAASAALTFLVANPGNQKMIQNLEFYKLQPKVDVNEVVDLESEDFQVLYKLGMEAYSSRNWGETVAALEEVLLDYLSWENNCRVECERQPEQEWSPELTITLSNNIAALLACRQQCQDKLKTLDYHSGRDFLADVLNYLQISYYRLDRIGEAAKAVASYLALIPEDEDMLENKSMYSTIIDSNAFLERSDVVHYLERDTYEKHILNLFHQGNNHNIQSNSI